MNRSFIRIASLFAFVAILFAPAAFAQDVDLTDDELTAFANAYLDVEDIQVRFDEEVAATEDPEQVEAIQAQYQEQVNAAIAARGLETARYDEVVQAMQDDAEFAQRVLAKVQEVREERMGG